MSDASKNFEWPSLADQLGERFDAECVEPGVRALFEADATRRLLVACSGGADSVFMLCWLYAHREGLGLDLSVAHYNHRWRGESSAEDEAFVRALADGLGVPFYIEARPENEAAFTETTARALRLDFLRRIAGETNCEYIALGHQLDDVLETQLQRLARGVGTDGLAAPRPIARFDGQPTHLRPLLNLRSGDIRMALNAIGIPWREDSSNEDTTIARNALRHDVIPDLMDALGRDPALGAARTRKLLEEDAAALDAITCERLPEAFEGAGALSRQALAGLPRALVRRALSAWLNTHELIECFSAQALELLIDGLASGRESYRQSAGASFVCVDKVEVWIEAGAEAEADPLQHVQFEPGETVVLSSGHMVEAELRPLGDPLRKSILGGEIDPACEAYLLLPPDTPLTIRSWQPGDRFQPLGAPGSKKLKDWFIDRHIPRKERKQLPIVITASGEIIWVPGFPPAERLKINSKTKQALRLTYRPRKPR